jgi:hypothetical protein
MMAPPARRPASGHANGIARPTTETREYQAIYAMHKSFY